MSPFELAKQRFESPQFTNRVFAASALGVACQMVEVDPAFEQLLANSKNRSNLTRSVVRRAKELIRAASEDAPTATQDAAVLAYLVILRTLDLDCAQDVARDAAKLMASGWWAPRMAQRLLSNAILASRETPAEAVVG